MIQTVEAVFANGVLTPLQPLSLEENQRVTLSVASSSIDDFLDHEFLASHANMDRPVPSLEEVRQMLSVIPESMTDLIRQERDER